MGLRWTSGAEISFCTGNKRFRCEEGVPTVNKYVELVNAHVGRSGISGRPSLERGRISGLIIVGRFQYNQRRFDVFSLTSTLLLKRVRLTVL